MERWNLIGRNSGKSLCSEGILFACHDVDRKSCRVPRGKMKQYFVSRLTLLWRPRPTRLKGSALTCTSAKEVSLTVSGREGMEDGRDLLYIIYLFFFLLIFAIRILFRPQAFPVNLLPVFDVLYTYYFLLFSSIYFPFAFYFFPKHFP